MNIWGIILASWFVISGGVAVVVGRSIAHAERRRVCPVRPDEPEDSNASGVGRRLRAVRSID